MDIPPPLRWMEQDPAAREWLRTVPGLLERCKSRWGLTLGPLFPTCHVSWTCPATRVGGDAVVLKLQFPHPETEHEADALRHWSGNGAVRLLDHAPELHALLIERCEPGDHLSTRPDEESLEVILDLLRCLSVPADRPFRTLTFEAAEWSDEIPLAYERTGRPFERRLVDAALEALAVLPASQSETVLLHQDLHAHNVLAAGQGRWLAIDPKPLVGERAFALAPVIRSNEMGLSRDAVIRRLRQGSQSLGLDLERARGWAIGQTVAWAFTNEGAIARHVETARWLLEDAG